ncbi:hypothetical protein F4861DRAFT_335501 [Xylaria intraflava]|nr:hypothetical protein F4861DRAFT_335501 [Xylaria intraflava]
MTTSVVRAAGGDDAPAPTGIVVTADNQNPIIQVITWLFLALFSLALGFRFLSTFYLKTNRLLRWDHISIILAYITAVGQSVTLLVPGSNIFGTNIQNASADELRVGMKIEYAGELLFIVSLGCAKLSVCTGLYTFSIDQTHRVVNATLIVATILWMLSSFLGIAFQCGSHTPWDTDGATCVNLHALFSYVDIVSIITDVALVIVPIAIISPLQMTLRTRIIVMALFGSRILVAVATVFQLIYLPRFIDHQFTIMAVPYYIASQTTQYASITTACVAYFWPFFRSVRSGLVSANITAPEASYSLSRLQKLQKQNQGVFRVSKNYVKITTDTSVRSTVCEQGPVDELSFQRERYINSWDESLRLPQPQPQGSKR